MVKSVQTKETTQHIVYHNEQNFLFVIRQFFVPAELRALRERIGILEQQIQAHSERDRIAAAVGIAPDALRLKPEWFDIWKSAKLCLLQEYIPQFSQVIYPLQIRTVKDRKSFTHWHQDRTYMLALGARAHHKIATCFVPLDEEPDLHPTVQFCLFPKQESQPHLQKADVQINQFYIPESSLPLTDIQTYSLELGDVLVFGQWVIHRTFFHEETFPLRHSLEFRLTTPEERIQGKDYFDLHTHEFYIH